MQRRRSLQYLTLLGVSSGTLLAFSRLPEDIYSLPEFGNATLLHFTDCHAQLQPVYYREPGVNIGVGSERGQPPHLTGKSFLKYYGIEPRSLKAYAFSSVDFPELARQFGKMGGFAHLATLVKRLRDSRGAGNTLLLDGGDSWQGSATALWTKGQDMLSACNQLGVNIMTGHWEFTYGSEQVLANIARFSGEFIAQNVTLSEEARFERDSENDRVFKSYVIREMDNARIALIGQAFPYTPIANPRRFIPDWQFGIQQQRLQQLVNDIRERRLADVVVLLSHNGMDVDLKLASRVSGIDIILGGHSHDAIPEPRIVRNAGGRTWVSNAGSNGKFLAVVDLQIEAGRMRDCRYHLLPVFANLLPADPEMQDLIDAVRKPYLKKLQQPLEIADRLLYRRDTFQGSFDQLLLDAQLKVNDAQIALSPGFRWGTTLLPGQTITLEEVMNQTAITYPEAYTRAISGRELHAILEDVADNLFHPDPYYRQGGDMVRVGGMTFRCHPDAPFGRRIFELRLPGGELLDAGKRYKVAGWAAVGAAASGRPIWDVVADYLQG